MDVPRKIPRQHLSGKAGEQAVQLEVNGGIQEGGLGKGENGRRNVNAKNRRCLERKSTAEGSAAGSS